MEEVGYRCEAGALGVPVWSGIAEFNLGGLPVRNLQNFFVLRVSTFEPTWDGMDRRERSAIRGYRWWPLAELVDHQLNPDPTEPVYPPNLGEQLLTLHHHEPRPASPDVPRHPHRNGGPA